MGIGLLTERARRTAANVSDPPHRIQQGGFRKRKLFRLVSIGVGACLLLGLAGWVAGSWRASLGVARAQPPLASPTPGGPVDTDKVGPAPWTELTVDSFSPAHFGLPDVVAGHRIIAVEALENSVCWPPNVRIVYIETPVLVSYVDQDGHAVLEGKTPADWDLFNRALDEVPAALKQLQPDPSILWDVQPGGGSTREDFFEAIVKKNQWVGARGCSTRHEPIKPVK